MNNLDAVWDGNARAISHHRVTRGAKARGGMDVTREATDGVERY